MFFLEEEPGNTYLFYNFFANFSFQNSNKILKTRKIGNSVLTLELGCITKTKVCLKDNNLLKTKV